MPDASEQAGLHRRRTPRVSLASTIGDLPWWYEHAKCTNDKSIGPDFFNPGQGASGRAIRRYCRPCPVRLECLARGLELRDEALWWGGEPPRALRRVRQGWPGG